MNHIFQIEICFSNYEKKLKLSTSVDGVTVSIVAFQAAVPGSTPGQRNFFFSLEIMNSQ